MAKKKSLSLAFIQMAWPIEVLGIIVFSMLALVFLPSVVGLWLDALGPISLLIGAQGGAASLGPAFKDWTESKKSSGETK